MTPIGETLNRVTPGTRKLLVVGTLAVAAGAAVVFGALLTVGAYQASRPTQFHPIHLISYQVIIESFQKAILAQEKYAHDHQFQ